MSWQNVYGVLFAIWIIGIGADAIWGVFQLIGGDTEEKAKGLRALLTIILVPILLPIASRDLKYSSYEKSACEAKSWTYEPINSQFVCVLREEK